MKKLLLIAALLPLQTFAAQSVTIYADESYPPYSYVENGKLTGIYTDILTELFAKMDGYSVNLKGNPWKRALKLMEAGDGFALYPPYKREESRPYMSYTNPILFEESAAYCKDKVLESTRSEWPKDYFGLTIGNSSGFAVGGAEFDAAVKNGSITLNESKGNRKNLLKLNAGRIDCFINDGLSIEWELSRMKKDGKYSSGISKGVVINSEGGYLGLTKNSTKFPYLNDFTEQYHLHLEAMKANGDIDKIIKKYTE
jgi:polar amino acid transport system substrate-binding protein